MSGSITAYQTAAGKRYRVRYRKPNKSQTDKRGFKTKREAETFLASVTVSKATGQYVDPAAARATVGALGQTWLATKKASMKPSSYRSIETAWHVHVEPMWGTTAVGDIMPSAVEEWIAALSEGTAPSERTRKMRSAIGPRSASVVLRCVGILAGILDTAVRDRRIHSNPARGARNLPRKHSSKTRRYLTDAQVIALASALDDTARRTLVMVLAYCGLRWGEAVALRVQDIDFRKRRIRVERSAVQVGGSIEIGAPKSWEKRVVPFPTFLAKPLKALCGDKLPAALLFPTAAGGIMRRPETNATAQSWWTAAIAAAGLELLTIHDLRHTAASLAVASGANVKAVQRMLGHKSAAVTLDVYADLFDSDLDDVAERLGTRAAEAGMGKVWANAAA